MAALVFLSDMQKKNLIKEVEGGFWMRLQSSQESDIVKHGIPLNHSNWNFNVDCRIVILNIINLFCVIDVKIVKYLPDLKGLDQPTIAIVTSLFCEKIAVDAMIEEKITYVKYKTEGYVLIIKWCLMKVLIIRWCLMKDEFQLYCQA